MSASSTRFFPNQLHDSEAPRDPDWLVAQAVDCAQTCTGEEPPDTMRAVDLTIYTGQAGLGHMCSRLIDLFEQLPPKPELEGHINALGILADQYLSRPVSHLASDMSHAAPSLLLGRAGYALAAALHWGAYGERTAAAVGYIEYYLSLLQIVTDNGFDADEFLYGRAGYLYGLLQLQWRAKDLGLMQAEHRDLEKAVDQVARAIVNSGRSFVRRGRLRQYAPTGHTPPMFWDWYGQQYLGAAHGAMGILHTLMLCPPSIMEDPHIRSDVEATVDFILAIRGQDGGYPAVLGEADTSLVHWCHGAPGAVFLFSQAYRVFGHERYLQAALSAGEVVWQKGLLKKGPGLCHGVAGNAYCFLCLYRLTQDSHHLRRAHRFAEFMASAKFDGVRLRPDNPYSLFEGLAGAACLYGDLLCPEAAEFPLFGGPVS